MNVNEAIEKYRKYLKVTRSKGTLDYYNGKVGILSQYLGHINCEDITEDILLDFIIKQRERNVDITNRTLNKYISSLRQTLAYSCKIDVVFGKLPEVKKVMQTIPLDIVHTVFVYYRKNQHNHILQRNYIMFRLFYETGLRISELLHLKVNDFNFERNTIHVKRNGNMEVLRQIMGHTSLKTTQKYLHINVDDLHKEYFRLYR